MNELETGKFDPEIVNALADTMILYLKSCGVTEYGHTSRNGWQFHFKELGPKKAPKLS